MGSEQQEQLDRQHAENPEPGDYWVEMLNPVLVVLEVSEQTVTFCQTKMTVGLTSDRWTWDLTKTTTQTRETFVRRLMYSSPRLEGKFWCHVMPQAHLWAIQERVQTLHELEFERTLQAHLSEDQQVAYHWAINTDYQSVAARYARSLAEALRDLIKDWESNW